MTSAVPEKTGRSNEWFTPELVLGPVREVCSAIAWRRDVDIELDPCTTSDNPVGAETFYTKDDDGLSMDWGKRSFFCNPPYSRPGQKRGDPAPTYDWIRKCLSAVDRGAFGFLLLPANRLEMPQRMEVYSSANLTAEVWLGKIEFIDEWGNIGKAPPYPSVLYVYGIPLGHLVETFADTFTVVGVDASYARPIPWKAERQAEKAGKTRARDLPPKRGNE